MSVPASSATGASSSRTPSSAAASDSTGTPPAPTRSQIEDAPPVSSASTARLAAAGSGSTTCCRTSQPARSAVAAADERWFARQPGRFETDPVRQVGGGVERGDPQAVVV